MHNGCIVCRVLMQEKDKFASVAPRETPDFPIAKMNDFYDRQALTEYIDNLF